MDENAGGLKVLMKLNSLDNITVVDYPMGYRWKWYSEGDETCWLKVQKESEPYIKMNSELYLKEFQKRHDDLGVRQGFLLNSKDEYVGTGTAWFSQFEHVGKVHWIALTPSEQGRGLSKLIIQEVLLKIKELSYTSSELYTSSRRIAAIKLYESFGFQPYLENEAYQLAWNDYLANVN